MREEVSTRLDTVDQLSGNSGRLDAYLFGSGTLDDGQVGLGASYSHRVSEGLSVFADGTIHHSYGNQSGLGWKALAGLRGVF